MRYSSKHITLHVKGIPVDQSMICLHVHIKNINTLACSGSVLRASVD